MNRRTRSAASILSALAALLAGAGPGRADDHVMSELKRTYMGRTYPTQTSEVWLDGDRTYVRDGAVVTITRQDLKKRWIILPGRKKYLEEPLGASPENRETVKPARIQEYGFDYEPSYEWTIRETSETATINGLPCRKVVARGDAAYAEEVREMWVAEGAPIDVKAYYERVVKPNLGEPWAKIWESHEFLRKGIIMKSRTTNEPAIAPPSVIEITVVRMEKSPPPEKIYEIPDGLRKVMTRAELYAR